MNTSFFCDNQQEKSFYIKFYPGIKASIGCEKATLILGRFEYWFTKYKKGFYKFIEPCNHPLYRTGDSWAEEIGFSRKAFVKAFDLIGVRYKSKSAFQKATDTFQGKLYASYHDRKKNQTYFFRNHDFANQFINNLFKRKRKEDVLSSKEIKNQDHLIKELSSPKGRSRKRQVGRSFNISIQKNTSSLKNTPDLLDHQPHTIMEEMIGIWKEEVGEIGIVPSKHFLKRLSRAFICFFDKSIESWKTYCQMISSSKFLMGEAQNKFFKKAWIIWAITEKAIEKIRGGVYKLGDRQTKLDKEINNIEYELKKMEIKKNILIENIDSFNESIKKERYEKIKEAEKQLSHNQLKSLKDEFKYLLEKENNSISEEYYKNGWNGLFVKTYFDNFLKEKIEASIFPLTLEEESNENLTTSRLNEKLQNIYHKINDLKKKRISLYQTKEGIFFENKNSFEFQT